MLISSMDQSTFDQLQIRNRTEEDETEYKSFSSKESIILDILNADNSQRVISTTKESSTIEIKTFYKINTAEFTMLSLVRLPFNKEQKVSVKITLQLTNPTVLEDSSSLRSLIGKEFGRFYSKLDLGPKLSQHFLTEFILELPPTIELGKCLFSRFHSPMNGYQTSDASNRLQYIYKHHKNLNTKSNWEYYNLYQNDFVDLEWTYSTVSETKIEYDFQVQFFADHHVPPLVSQALMKTNNPTTGEKRDYFFGLNGFKINENAVGLGDVTPALSVKTLYFDMTRDIINQIFMRRQGKVFLFSESNAHEIWLLKVISLEKSTFYRKTKKTKKIIKRRKRKGFAAPQGQSISFENLLSLVKSTKEPSLNLISNSEKEDFIKNQIINHNLPLFESNVISARLIESQRNASELLILRFEDEMVEESEFWSAGTGVKYKVTLNLSLIDLEYTDLTSDLQISVDALQNSVISSRIEMFEASNLGGFAHGIVMRIGFLISGSSSNSSSISLDSLPSMTTINPQKIKKQKKKSKIIKKQKKKTINEVIPQSQTVNLDTTTTNPVQETKDHLKVFLDTQTIKKIRLDKATLSLNKFEVAKVIMSEIINSISRNSRGRKNFVFLPMQIGENAPVNYNVKFKTRKQLILLLEGALMDLRTLENISLNKTECKLVDQLTFSIKVPSKTKYFLFRFQTGEPINRISSKFQMEVLSSEKHPNDITEESDLIPFDKEWFRSLQKDPFYTPLLRKVELKVFRGLGRFNESKLEFTSQTTKYLINAIERSNELWQIDVKTNAIVRNTREPTHYMGKPLADETIFNGGDSIKLQFIFTPDPNYSKRKVKSMVVSVEKQWSDCKESFEKFFTFQHIASCQKTYANSRTIMEFMQSTRPIIDDLKSIFFSKRIWTDYKNPIIFNFTRRPSKNIYQDLVDYVFDLTYSLDISSDLEEKHNTAKINFENDILKTYESYITKYTSRLRFSFHEIAKFLRGIAFEENPNLNDKYGIIQFLKNDLTSMPLVERAENFLKVLPIRKYPIFSLNENPYLENGDEYKFKIDMDSSGLKEEDALEYIKILKNNYEGKCLNYVENMEKYKVKIEQFKEVDLVNGQLDFGIRARVSLYEEKDKSRILI